MVNIESIHNHHQMWKDIIEQPDLNTQYSLWFNTIVSKVLVNTLPQKQMSKIMIIEEIQEPKEDYIALCVQNRHNNQIKFTISFVKPYLKNLFTQELEKYKDNVVSYVSFLEIVVLHELCHLKIMSHGKRFFRELRRLITKYLRNLHNTLDENTIEQINKQLHYLYLNEVAIYKNYKNYKTSKICR